MKKKIAVITGGNSSEYVISIKSANLIINSLDHELFESYRVEIRGDNWFATSTLFNEKKEIDKASFSIVDGNSRIKFDCAVIMIHGTPGEDGVLQGYLQTLNIPFTSSDVLASAATFNKYFTKKYIESFGIKTANCLLIHKDDSYNIDHIVETIKLPCFVKPNQAGSSFGVTKVKSKEQLDEALAHALTEDDEILIESLLTGRELTCGVLVTKKQEYKFPVTEIVSTKDFFDYEAKYTTGLAEEIVPANLPDHLAKECQELSLKIYKLFNCRWFARVDYILDQGKLVPLEINTIPGMSPESIIPKMLKAGGYKLQDILLEIIEDTINEKLS